MKELYGAGNGDFNQKTIQFSFTDDLELPKIVDVYFLDDGIPVSLVDSGSYAFDAGDISGVDANISNLVRVGTGHYQFELSPQDNSTPTNLLIVIDGDGVKTAGFQDTFSDSNFSYFYNPQTPVISSSSISRWQRGSQSSFTINATDATIVSVSNLPPGLDYNASTRTIWESRKSEAHPRLQLQLQILSHRLISHMNCESLTHWHFHPDLNFQSIHQPWERHLRFGWSESAPGCLHPPRSKWHILSAWLTHPEMKEDWIGCEDYQ